MTGGGVGVLEAGFEQDHAPARAGELQGERDAGSACADDAQVRGEARSALDRLGARNHDKTRTLEAVRHRPRINRPLVLPLDPPACPEQP